jgi:hypothetical protein
MAIRITGKESYMSDGKENEIEQTELDIEEMEEVIAPGFAWGS